MTCGLYHPKKEPREVDLGVPNFMVLPLVLFQELVQVLAGM